MKKYNMLYILLMCSLGMYSQNVGIGINSPNERLHVAGKVRIDSLAGSGAKLIQADSNGTLEKIPEGAHGEVITQTSAGLVYMKPFNFNSTSLGTDIQVSQQTWTNVPGMSVTFVATQDDAMIMFSASGFSFTNSMAFVQFRIRNGNATLGGTNTNMQNYDNTEGSVGTWSCTYTGKVSGLIIGSSYTYNVEAQVGGILGTYNAAIFPVSNPDTHHMTLTVMQ